MLIRHAEYQKASEQLDNEIVTEPSPWASGLRRRWHWDFLVNLTLDLPLVSYQPPADWYTNKLQGHLCIGLALSSFTFFCAVHGAAATCHQYPFTKHRRVRDEFYISRELMPGGETALRHYQLREKYDQWIKALSRTLTM